MGLSLHRTAPAMTYTTAELLRILDRELDAAWRGERVVLSAGERLENPVVAKALGMEKLSQVFAVQDFRAQIHAYQRSHQVSGLVWQTCHFRDQTVRFPEVHPQLVAIPADKVALHQAKGEVIAFWRRAIAGLDLWHVAPPPSPPVPIGAAAVEPWIGAAEWAEVAATRTELSLSLCWGDPKVCHCHWARPQSGCEQVIAAAIAPSTVKF